jgi:TRAP-type mannitol/chloroaromatic compound transport system permease large subunit
LKEPGVAKAQDGKSTKAEPQRKPAPTWLWVVAGIVAVGLAVLYALLTFERLEIFKMLLASFFPLAIMILAVLGTIVFGLATPTEAAAVGSFGGFALAAIYFLIKKAENRKQIALIWAPFLGLGLFTFLWLVLFKVGIVSIAIPNMLGTATVFGLIIWTAIAYKQVNMQQPVKESVFLTAKTSAMVCWLFVGSSIFSAAFALLGGQEIVETWVMSLGLTKVQFLLLSQVIIFVLGWPLEWTEIIVIFMPIFIPLLDNFGVDPLFFGLLVALNLQTAFLSPPVAMAAFYLKGVAPPSVTLNQIFLGMMPFMMIQIIALALLYIFPEIGLWLPAWIDKVQR